ncbi:unnamed protein product [Brassica rapa subsp. trilocularis]
MMAKERLQHNADDSYNLLKLIKILSLILLQAQGRDMNSILDDDDENCEKFEVLCSLILDDDDDDDEKSHF